VAGEGVKKIRALIFLEGSASLEGSLRGGFSFAGDCFVRKVF